MQTIGVTLFHIIAIMVVLLAVSLLMGKRQIGELSPLDFIVAITVGTVAGAGIVDPRIDLATVVISITLMGLLQFVITWLSIKNRDFRNKVNFTPTVLVENGMIIKANLRKIRLPVETLLALLREKDAFDINEIELAILEPHGKVSVLKKAEYQPLKPWHANIPVTANKILTLVVMEGKLQENALRQIGFSARQISELRDDYKDILDSVFVAFMDQNRQLYIINEDIQEKGLFHH